MDVVQQHKVEPGGRGGRTQTTPQDPQVSPENCIRQCIQTTLPARRATFLSRLKPKPKQDAQRAGSAVNFPKVRVVSFNHRDGFTDHRRTTIPVSDVRTAVAIQPALLIYSSSFHFFACLLWGVFFLAVVVAGLGPRLRSPSRHMPK